MPRLLILDDEVSVTITLAETARSKGWQASATHDPQEALALLRKNSADVFLTDFQMPDCTGLEIIEVLRQSHPTLPTLLMSGSPEEIDLAFAQRLGVLAILEKPFDLDCFVRALKKALPAARESSTQPTATAPRSNADWQSQR